MPTKFSRDDYAHSDAAHRTARRVIYPMALETPIEQIEYEDTTSDCGLKGELYDMQLGIDRVLHVKGIPKLRAPLLLTVQERFRRPKYYDNPKYRRQVTLTEWNEKTDVPSELYKIHAQWFAYGFYDNASDTILKAVIINVPTMIQHIINKLLPFEIERHYDKQIPFIALNEDDLIRTRSLFYKYEKGKHEFLPKDRRISEVNRWLLMRICGMQQEAKFEFLENLLMEDGEISEMIKPLLKRIAKERGRQPNLGLFWNDHVQN